MEKTVRGGNDGDSPAELCEGVGEIPDDITHAPHLSILQRVILRGEHHNTLRYTDRASFCHQITVPSGTTVSLMTMTMPFLIQYPSLSRSTFSILSLLIIFTFRPMRAFLSIMAFLTTALLPMPTG